MNLEDFRGAGEYEADNWNLFDENELFTWPEIMSLIGNYQGWF